MLEFELLKQDQYFKDGDPEFVIYRARIPGGWLVVMRQFDFDCGGPRDAAGWGWGYGGMTFVPDPQHAWNGSSIDAAGARD